VTYSAAAAAVAVCGAIYAFTLFFKFYWIRFRTPAHETPFPVYPDRQVHVTAPSASSQMALASQPPLLVSQPSTSAYDTIDRIKIAEKQRYKTVRRTKRNGNKSFKTVLKQFWNCIEVLKLQGYIDLHDLLKAVFVFDPRGLPALSNTFAYFRSIPNITAALDEWPI